MRHSLFLLPLVSGLLIVSPARAQFGGPLSVSGRLTYAVPIPGDLRARLLEHANAVVATDPMEAATALNCRGMSFARDGESDSAVTCYERAFALDASRRLPLADERLRRAGRGDAERVIELLRPGLPRDLRFPAIDQIEGLCMFAWAQYLAGHPDSADRIFTPLERRTIGPGRAGVPISQRPLNSPRDWRYRMGCVALALNDWPRAIQLLTPLAVASRGFDPDVMDMMRTAAKKMNTERNLELMVKEALQPLDDDEDAVVAAMGARRLGFTGSDGFTLGGVLLTPPTSPTPPRAAVIVMAPDDPLETCDSLAAGIRRLGFAVMLLYPRGSGRSVGKTCPMPETWRGRETVMQSVCAGDVGRAVMMLAREASADTSRYLLIGLGASGPIAVEAAARDPRARVLMLASPTASVVDRGAMRARVAAIKRPVYFQTGPENYLFSGELIDSLYQACDMRASRIADSEREGVGATLFRPDPKIFDRFTQWLEESWPAAIAPPATRPSRPRKG